MSTSIMASTLNRVNFDSDAIDPADLEWAAHHLNIGRTDYFIPGEPSPPPGDDAAPAEPEPAEPPPDLDADAIACMDAYTILDRLSADKPVSLPQLARMWAYFDAPMPDVDCCCLLPEPHCGCGTRLWRDGLTAYTAYARETLVSYDRWLDSLADEFDPYADDRDHCDRACFH